MIKGDKRTKVNSSNFPSFIDFLIPGSQKKSGANHVKSRQQLSSRPKTVRHFYPTIRKRKLNYNKPFSSINPNFLAAKVIKPKGKAKAEPSFVENFDFSSRQQSNKTKLGKKFKKKVSISSPIRKRFEKYPRATSINVVHSSESDGANSRNGNKLNSRNKSLFIGPSRKPAKKEVTKPSKPINQRKLKKYDQDDFYQRKDLKVADIHTSIVEKRQGFAPKEHVLRKSSRLTLTKAPNPKPMPVYRSKSLKKVDNSNPVFEFETNISVSLDSNGYLLTIILISQIIIFGMVLYSRSLHDKTNYSSNE